MASVDNQNTEGSVTDFHPTWLLFTMNALVSPANIMMRLPMATHKVNL
jgi:hypothetical protein